ncbi:hypothetical protein F4553_001149 [Allocatelliglobosispora scoriae]|uniref:Uncharacterized protein n=1 Tax=Allocatelliglobosispora scoriae TaxID=643052 RepID=A0A841BLS0_9ACTN|nr:hypothetical protein [Allocatelliglobosispora scoriae]MBB5867770.1 hypothetical protein [Allocatelliglobosispora scoriae]
MPAEQLGHHVGQLHRLRYGELGCFSGGHAGQFTITWNTSDQTTIAFTNTVALRPLGETVVVARGSVVSGTFVGASYTATFTLFQVQPLACLGTGVTTAQGPTTLLLTR